MVSLCHNNYNFHEILASFLHELWINIWISKIEAHKIPDFSETVFQIKPKEFHADSRKTKLYTNLLRIVGRDYKQRIYVVTHRDRRFIL